MNIQLSRYKKTLAQCAIFLARYPLVTISALLVVMLLSFGLFFYRKFLLYQTLNAMVVDTAIEFQKETFQKIIRQSKEDEDLRKAASSLSPADIFH
ncbi:MAG: hypothetical protein HYV78_01190 [Candidatus Wildermuthbacteria bacterium]|nr:hypothetical protein [Candidatus Wildermuthbacteria bacterium]